MDSAPAPNADLLHLVRRHGNVMGVSHEIERADSTSRTAPGLGRNSSGPAFAPPASGLPLADRPLGTPPPAPQPPPELPRRRSLLLRIAPAVGTFVILALAAVIIVAGSVQDNRKAAEQARRPVPSPVITAPPAVASDPAGEPDAIEFTTPQGRGELTVIDHTWLRKPGSSEVRLRVQVELRALDGVVDYDPAYFFAARDLANPVRAEDSFAHGDLDVGVLEPGDAARGYLTFLLPRGDVTLMMSSDAADWITAIKIVD
ncbi:hypothetical protein GCM10028864_49550 [Microlunatus parietis]